MARQRLGRGQLCKLDRFDRTSAVELLEIDRDAGDCQLPEHVTTPLLTLITARSMDEDYAHVAQKRAAAGFSCAQAAQIGIARV